jgi:hypothetical protein
MQGAIVRALDLFDEIKLKTQDTYFSGPINALLTPEWFLEFGHSGAVS